MCIKVHLTSKITEAQRLALDLSNKFFCLLVFVCFVFVIFFQKKIKH